MNGRQGRRRRSTHRKAYSIRGRSTVVRACQTDAISFPSISANRLLGVGLDRSNNARHTDRIDHTRSRSTFCSRAVVRYPGDVIIYGTIRPSRPALMAMYCCGIKNQEPLSIQPEIEV